MKNKIQTYLKFKVSNNRTTKMITEKEGYQATFYFLSKWYEFTKSDDVGEILSLMETLDDGEPVDVSMWNYWIEAIERVRKVGLPPHKMLK